MRTAWDGCVCECVNSAEPTGVEMGCGFITRRSRVMADDDLVSHNNGRAGRVQVQMCMHAGRSGA